MHTALQDPQQLLFSASAERSEGDGLFVRQRRAGHALHIVVVVAKRVVHESVATKLSAIKVSGCAEAVSGIEIAIESGIKLI